MAVTKQTYTATPTWTAAQLADIYRSAFIDAGLMADWFDSFLSGSIQNRILRVQYDASKTYGTTFYWFMFSTSGVHVNVATGWNASTHVPVGTQYLDYFSTTTNDASNHWRFSGPYATYIPSSTLELVRYTSAVDLDQSWFVVKNSTMRICFSICSESKSLQPWIDLDKGFYQGFTRTVLSCISRRSAFVSFERGPILRRELFVGSALTGSTLINDYTNGTQVPLLTYGAVGNATNSATNNYLAFFTGENVGDSNFFTRRAGSIILPVGFSSTNPAYSVNSNPVFHSMPYSPYVVDSLPSDFGLTFHYATNSFSLGDTLVVDSGVEEWEVLDFDTNASSVTGASPLFLARTV